METLNKNLNDAIGIIIKKPNKNDDGNVVMINAITNRKIENIIHDNKISMDIQSLFDIGWTLEGIKKICRVDLKNYNVDLLGGGKILIVFRRGEEI